MSADEYDVDELYVPPPPIDYELPELAEPVPTGWQNRAACASLPPSTVFSARPAHERIVRARCAVCPVIGDCAEAARIEERDARPRDVYFIRGGLDPAERIAGRTASIVACDVCGIAYTTGNPEPARRGAGRERPSCGSRNCYLERRRNADAARQQRVRDMRKAART